MSVEERAVRQGSAKHKLVDALIKLFFENGFIIFGGCVRDYIIPKYKLYPIDFDIGVDDINEAKTIIINTLYFSFDIEEENIENDGEINHSKLELIHKFSSTKKPIKLSIDISLKKVIGSNLDFDVNSIYMTNDRSFHLVDSIQFNSLTEIINNINRKKFRILKTYKKPMQTRREIGINESSKKLIEYVKIMERTSKMLSRGYKLSDQILEEIFEPCLIKKIDNLTNNCDVCNICNICASNFRPYELELYCCKQIICFSCVLNHIKGRYGNTDIFCPYCRGDPFGWKTIGGVDCSDEEDIPIDRDIINDY